MNIAKSYYFVETFKTLKLCFKIRSHFFVPKNRNGSLAIMLQL